MLKEITPLRNLKKKKPSHSNLAPFFPLETVGSVCSSLQLSGLSFSEPEPEKERVREKLHQMLPEEQVNKCNERVSSAQGTGSSGICFLLSSPGQSPHTQTQFVFRFLGLIPLETLWCRYYVAGKI